MKRWISCNRLLCSVLTVLLCAGLWTGLASATAAPGAEIQKDSQGKVNESKDSQAKNSFTSTAEAFILLEPSTGTVILEKNSHKQLPPASVTKIMTLYLAMEAVADGKVNLKDRVKCTEEAASLGGSQIYLEPGEEFTFEELLISVAVGSANDASVAVAEHVAGSHDEFVDLMNEKAKVLGLKDTHFVNAYGLPAEGHVTSAHDMAMILREALKYPLFRRISGTKEYDLRGGEFKLINTNKLLWWYKGADAGKTGWTNEAKYCLASSTERDGLRLIAVVLGTPETRSHFRESIRLYNYGFAKFRGVTVAESGARIKLLQVEKGKADLVSVIAKDRIGIMVPKGQEKDVTHRVVLPATLEAPVKQGQVVGSIILSQKGKDMVTFPLVAECSVEKASLWQQLGRACAQVYGSL